MTDWASRNPSRGVKREIKPRGILVVDDDPDYLWRMVKMLTEQGFSPIPILFMDKQDKEPSNSPSEQDIIHFRREGAVATSLDDLLGVIQDAQANTLGIVSDFNLSTDVRGDDIPKKLKEMEITIPFMINSGIGSKLVRDDNGVIRPEYSSMAQKNDPLLSEWIKQSLFEQHLSNFESFTATRKHLSSDSVLAQAKAAQSLIQLAADKPYGLEYTPTMLLPTAIEEQLLRMKHGAASPSLALEALVGAEAIGMLNIAEGRGGRGI
jgi:hypothetical protein